jgi:hypothetical protein
MIPILRPDILILTKIKRCVQYIGSTRPRSVRKFHFDLSDIVFLLGWLKAHGHKIDFDGYDTTDDKRERLYSAVKDLAGYWEEGNFNNEIDLLRTVLSKRDQEALNV